MVTHLDDLFKKVEEAKREAEIRALREGIGGLNQDLSQKVQGAVEYLLENDRERLSSFVAEFEGLIDCYTGERGSERSERKARKEVAKKEASKLKYYSKKNEPPLEEGIAASLKKYGCVSVKHLNKLGYGRWSQAMSIGRMLSWKLRRGISVEGRTLTLEDFEREIMRIEDLNTNYTVYRLKDK